MSDQRPWQGLQESPLEWSRTLRTREESIRPRQMNQIRNFLRIGMMENKVSAIIFSLEKYVFGSLTIIFYFYDVGTCNKYDIENYRFKGPHRVCSYFQ